MEVQEPQDGTPTKRRESEKLQKQPKVDYQQKNLDHIQKIKQRKQRQLEEKQKDVKRDLQLREKLKRKVLGDAQKVKQNKEKENQKSEKELESLPIERPKRQVADSLPKQPRTTPVGQKERFKKRHSEFLNSLTEGLKSKKEMEELQKRKKQQRYQKLKQGMGINKVESKLARIIEEGREAPRPSSADKADLQKSVSDCQKEPYSATSSKNFQDKHNEYIDNIRKKKVQEQLKKQEEEKKLQRRKEKLREFVMTTVKKNVLDGVYEDDLEEAKKTTKRKGEALNENQEIEEEDDDDSVGNANDNQDEQKPKKKRKMRSFPHVTDVVEWRKKNRLEPDTRVFIITGGYGDVKRALKARGWVHNPDSTSSCFNLKWVLQSRECEYGSLQQNQIVNHFQKNGAITTKIGLCKNLKGLKWVNNVNVDQFLPKCFDLNDEEDLTAFEQEFKICKALTILKLYMKLVSLKSFTEIQKIKSRVKVANDVLDRNIISLDDLIDKKKFSQVISPQEWQILAEGELNVEGLAKKKHQEWLTSINMKYNDTKEQQKQKKKKKKKKGNQDIQGKQEAQDKQEQEQDEFTKEVQTILDKYEKSYPQFSLTNTNNIWILKPAGLSRGRGITCYNSLVEIQDHVKSKESQWVAQKYIENPLVMCKRKFDIRQWVLVTSFNPLVVWKYSECYIRFSALDYNVEDVSNKFVHLTNNSIASLHKNFDKSEIKGNMYSQDQFKEFLMQSQGHDVFQEKIRDEMTNIIKWSMQGAQEHVEHRKNSHQLYGYDFMVDEDNKVWLIQINSSPSMDYSTHITSKLVKSCLQDVVKVVVDYNSAPKKQRKKIDTGGFKIIYKGTEVPQKHITTGLNLGIEGVPLKRGPNKKGSIKVDSAKN